MLKVNHEKCTGCGTCLDACIVEAISLRTDKAEIDQKLCNACGECAVICPSEAIIAVDAPLPAEIIPSQPIRVSKAQTTVMTTSQKITPFIGSVLSLASRELLPRFADAIVGSLEKRLEKSAHSMPDIYPHAPQESLGRRRRQRKRAGRR